MKKFVVFIVVALVGLYLFFQWKKKSKATKINTDIPQNPASNLSNIAPIRQDIITNQDLTNDKASSVNSSSTSDNPVTRENAQPISVTEHLTDVVIASSPGVPLQPVLSSQNNPIQLQNTPIVSDSIVNGIDQFTSSGGITPDASGDKLVNSFTGSDGITQYTYQRPNGNTYTTTVKVA